MAEFGITRDGKLIDLRPMSKGENINVWDFDLKQWVAPGSMTVGSITDSIPVDEDTANTITETGDLPDDIKQRLARDW